MSIQRYRFTTPITQADNGPWVTYADHLAEVSRARIEVMMDGAEERVEECIEHQREAAEAMRAACIAAVEALPIEGEDFYGRELIVLRNALAALREVTL